MSRSLARQVPGGFEILREGRRVVILEAEMARAIREAGLLEPGALEAELRRAGGRTGRAPTAVVALLGRNERLVLRAVLHGGWLGPWLGRRMLGLGRPLRELAVTAALRTRGAPVPRPALVWAERRSGPVWQGGVATVEIPQTVDGLQFLESHPDRARVEHAAQLAGRAVRCFHDAGGLHADLHVKNLLLRLDPEPAQVFVIDLDRARLAERVSPARRMRELMRLYRSLYKRNLREIASERICVALFLAYVGDDSTLGSALLAHLPRERLRVALHTLAYKRR